MLVIAILSYKGGSGKTTTSVNLSGGLAREGKKVVVVDLCLQGNTTEHYGIRPGGGYDPYNITEPRVINENLSLIPADPLVLGKYEKAPVKRLNTSYGEDKDIMVIDCPPTLASLTTSAIVASDMIIMPVDPVLFSYTSFEATDEFIDDLEKKGRLPKSPERRILITKFNKIRRLDRAFLDQFKDKPQLLKTKIPVNTELGIAPSTGKDIFAWAPKSKGALAYAELAREVLNG